MSEEVTNTGSEEAVVADSATVETAVETSAPFDFRTELAEDLRDDPTIADIKDLNSLVKSYKSAQTMIGGSVRIPGEDASEEQRSEFYSKLESVPGVAKMPSGDNPEEVAAFYRKLGCPESVDKYDLGLPEEFSVEGYEPLLEAAHKAGLNNEQLRTLAQAEVQKNMAQMEAMQEAKVAGEKIINEAFGADKEARIAGAKAAARVYGEKYPDAVNELLNGPAGNNPALVMILADLGKNLVEQGHDGMKASPQYGTTPAEANMKIQEIRNNPTHAYYDSSSPDHQAAVAKMKKLYELAYPGQ